ncbi:hypothetical protein [Azospirillum rugosum]|uniref:Hemerythrin HHE cation binding domain-containing protein n=1 Tax=Azospirillum rugosum TaxID=416170 RepID=A0ABS4SYF4_9PROT|nr:hypothetical protein [Azospirillum rugosum]MBP2296425.1 hypothetical protein [Azospirillum rugosum]MDQ0529946.1 hypothetical protein [Azospirillum rugosum]
MTGQASRYDMYRLIHKALRGFMVDTLAAVGRMDADDDGEVAAVLGRVRSLLTLCASHVEHENRFVHTAMEARAPGSSADIASDHDHHARDLAALAAAVGAVEAAHGPARADAAHALYRRLALFVGENLAHMEAEESHNNGVLWRTHRDEELQAIEQAIVAAQPPEEMMLVLRWMLASATPAERANLLGGIRAMAPAEAFAGMMALAQSVLAPADHDKLTRALAAPALAA